MPRRGCRTGPVLQWLPARSDRRGRCRKATDLFGDCCQGAAAARSAARRPPVGSGAPLLPALPVALAVALSLFQVVFVQRLVVLVVLDGRGPSWLVLRAFHRSFHPRWAYSVAPVL